MLSRNYLIAVTIVLCASQNAFSFGLDYCNPSWERVGGSHFVGSTSDLPSHSTIAGSIAKWFRSNPKANPYFGRDSEMYFQVVKYSLGKNGALDVFNADIDFYLRENTICSHPWD